MAKSRRPRREESSRPATRNSRTTVSGPADAGSAEAAVDTLAGKLLGTDELSVSLPFNPLKASEYEPQVLEGPEQGPSVTPRDPIVGASTVTERNGSDKVGSGGAIVGVNKTIASLDRVRVDSSKRPLTTNQGVPVADNQHSLKAGLRGPTLLEDFILREKITHFDHERIPERIVHARGSAAHGFFECYEPLQQYTRASLFAEAGKQTPVFVRFSTVLGERGSTDTARDVRGFAVKFYTDEGNWDLVGNNIPVFFIQDAMKFPDLVHAAKPEPHFAMPQAASAHDTFWDFASLMPEITHMLMWAMSDRAIPRSYRTMQGFGVHTYRLVNEAGESHFVKFHWSADALERIRSCGMKRSRFLVRTRTFTAGISGRPSRRAPTPNTSWACRSSPRNRPRRSRSMCWTRRRSSPRNWCHSCPVGRLVLNRNPDNFFAETEQVAFCVAHVVPGIDFSNDPLLAGRIHSYVDTQISRLGGPNFHEIPINAPVAQVHNNQRDGMHRQAIHRGRVSYEPNSLAGGCPFQAGKAGFMSFPEPRQESEHKIRGKAERFADHYTQATLFWNSQTDIEKQHIIGAFRFELSRVQTPAVRERMVSGLMNVASELATAVATGLGIREMPEPMPRAMTRTITPEVSASSALSLFARPGDGTIRARRVAVLVADGCDAEPLLALTDRLISEGAVPRFVSTRLGPVDPSSGETIEVDVSLEAAPSVLYDAVVLPSGESAITTLQQDGRTLEFLKDQYRHCKPLLALTGADSLLQACGISPMLPTGEPDPGVIIAVTDGADTFDRFVAAIAKHRHFQRETDPPRV